MSVSHDDLSAQCVRAFVVMSDAQTPDPIYCGMDDKTERLTTAD